MAMKIDGTKVVTRKVSLCLPYSFLNIVIITRTRVLGFRGTWFYLFSTIAASNVTHVRILQEWKEH